MVFYKLPSTFSLQLVIYNDDEEYLYAAFQQNVVHRVVYIAKYMVPSPQRSHNLKKKLCDQSGSKEVS